MNTAEKNQLIADFRQHPDTEYEKLVGSIIEATQEYSFYNRIRFECSTSCNSDGLPETCCGAGHKGCTNTLVPIGTRMRLEEFKPGPYPVFIITINTQKFIFHWRRLSMAFQDKKLIFKDTA